MTSPGCATSTAATSASTPGRDRHPSPAGFERTCVLRLGIPVDPDFLEPDRREVAWRPDGVDRRIARIQQAVLRPLEFRRAARDIRQCGIDSAGQDNIPLKGDARDIRCGGKKCVASTRAHQVAREDRLAGSRRSLLIGPHAKSDPGAVEDRIAGDLRILDFDIAIDG